MFYAATPGPVDELRLGDGGRTPRSEAELARALAKLGVDVTSIESALKAKPAGPSASDRITW